jgi:hypothetical protein
VSPTGGENSTTEISKRASAFDPIALLDLLAHLGYRPEEILFESHESVASQPRLIHSIEFKKSPIRHVVISLNMGLLATQSPLPTYFRDLLQDADLDEQAFAEFLRFFDHRLLQNSILAIYPERDTTVIRDWEQMKLGLLKLLGIRSESTLHWLFQLACPELEVRVDRGTLSRFVKLDGAELGVSVVGDPRTVLGGWTKAPVPGFHVTLFCEEEHTDFGRPWAEDVRRRLDSIVFPVISDAALELKVSLVIRSEKVWAQLRPGSYLGFDRIKGGARRNREVQVFKGTVVPGTYADKMRAPSPSATAAPALAGSAR